MDRYLENYKDGEEVLGITRIRKVIEIVRKNIGYELRAKGFKPF